jgi:hypothetical protein
MDLQEIHRQKHRQSIPRAEFQDPAGKQNVFDDGLATTIFPKHTSVVGELVVACLSHHLLLLLEPAPEVTKRANS